MALRSSCTRCRRRPPVDDKAGLGHVAVGEMEGDDEPCRRDDRGPVLVVMEHRDVHEPPQALLDDEALRCPDVLQVDPLKEGPR